MGGRGEERRGGEEGEEERKGGEEGREEGGQERRAPGNDHIQTIMRIEEEGMGGRGEERRGGEEGGEEGKLQEMTTFKPS